MPSRLTFIAVWALPLLLLGGSMAVAALHSGRWAGTVNIAVGGMSALLIAWFDMHLESARGILRLFAVGLVLFLLIMFGLGLADWLTR